jgi:rsbT co-antagonist protein RsbR
VPSTLPEIIRTKRQQLHMQWMAELRHGLSGDGRIDEAELSEQTGEFLRVLAEATSDGGWDHVNGPGLERVRHFLTEVSRSRAIQGFLPAETASFVFSLKKPLFEILRRNLERQNPENLAEEIWRATELIDSLGMHTFNAYQQSREEVIHRQQAELLELSTPVVKLWEGILALPMIGTLDSARAQTVMESLLQRIVETGSQIAIIDITGVPTVDTLVAQHLLKTISAIRLMGADCIISGIRPQIAQTIVHLGITLEGVTTRGTLADALALALRRSGLTITSPNNRPGA